MPITITQPSGEASPAKSVAIACTRLLAMKRRWRATAADGTEFLFDLERPLVHGVLVHVADGVGYVLDVAPEPLLEVSLDIPPSAAAGVGWAVGNLHLELMSEPHRLLTPDEPAARQLLDRIGIAFTPVVDRFRPGRFARGTSPSTHELGASHKH